MDWLSSRASPPPATPPSFPISSHALLQRRRRRHDFLKTTYVNVDLGLHVTELLQERCSQTEAYLDDAAAQRSTRPTLGKEKHEK